MHVDLNLDEFETENPEKEKLKNHISFLLMRVQVKFYLSIETIIKMMILKLGKNILYITNFYLV